MGKLRENPKRSKRPGRSVYADFFGKPALKRKVSEPRDHGRPAYLDAYWHGRCIVAHFQAHPVETLHGILDALRTQRGGEHA